MTRQPITRPGLLLAALLLPLVPLRAEDEATRDLLRDALYAEEVSRDAAKAAENYQKVLDRYDEQQPFAAAALFRLAEVRRKQGNKDEAVRLYQRLLREFPAAETEGKLARENLTALGAKDIPTAGTILIDEEGQELQRVKELAKSSPDLVRGGSQARDAIGKGQVRVLEFLLDAGFIAEPATLLHEAVGAGNVRITELLLKRSGDLDPRLGQGLLWDAVGWEYREVALVLLKHKVSANFLQGDGKRLGDGTMKEQSPLHLAVLNEDLEMCRILLDQGADPNLMPPLCCYPGEEKTYAYGSALHEAVMKDEKIARLLVEKGAKVDLAAPVTGLTPLHLAAVKNATTTIRLLLEKGAPVDARSLEVIYPASNLSPQPAGQTPLMMAVGRGSREAAKLLLDKGADVNAIDGYGRPVIYRGLWSESTSLLPLLLEHKADPNARFGPLPEVDRSKDPFESDVSSHDSTLEPLIVKAAARESGLETVKVLLDAGAVPGAELELVIRNIATMDADGGLMRRLVSLHKGGINLQKLPEMEDWKPGARTAFLETAVYPALSRQDQPWLLFSTTGRVVRPERNASGSNASSLALQLLLNKGELLNNYGRFKGITLVRKDAEGNWTRLPVDLKADAPLPDLKRGDVIEVETDSPRQSYSTTTDEANSVTLWALRRRVSFPVTMEIDGKSREFTVRGDSFIFDPSKAEVPWMGASNLAALLWRPEVYPESGEPASITLVRAGWPDVRILWGQNSSSDFALEPGDKLVVRSAAVGDIDSSRRGQIAFISSGLPFGSYIRGPVDAFGNKLPGSSPTLLQALAELVQGEIRGLGGAPESPDNLGRWLILMGKQPVPLLTHPDYSRIRIRRLQEDGKEQIIPVDLAAVIAASSAETTPQQARESDLPLQPGDIVDIPVQEGKAGQAWKGLSEKEEAFFAKALGCRVQVQKSDGTIDLNEIIYRAPRFVPVGSSFMPLPPLSGSSSLRSSTLIQQSAAQVRVTRANEPKNEVWASPSQVFLRDGDLLEVLVQRNSPPGSPQPRPRIVPPAPGANR